jgi:hypothetical protein
VMDLPDIGMKSNHIMMIPIEALRYRSAISYKK